MDLKTTKIAVLGLGYVGLPLAVEFGKLFPTVGFDIKQSRVDQLKDRIDTTLEVSTKQFEQADKLTFTASKDDLKACNFYIVTVPTPIDKHKQPDLSPLLKASELIASVIDKGDVVVYESTVYPGATEEDCIPVIEKHSGLIYNQDFFAGYSPERINPGDKKHTVTKILKITSGSTAEAANYIDSVYRSIITAGTHLASSIKVAEAAKVIENTQRDVNIALINELAIIFNKLDIDTLDVLEAAGTKWNFLPFRPGLVGGHCIGVDPYYLTQKAEQIGYHPKMILAGRHLNDDMGNYVVSQLVKNMMQQDAHVEHANVLVMGLTFKENCPDLRNTRVIDIVNELNEYNMNVDVYDPWCDKDEAKALYNIDLLEKPKANHYDAIIFTVAHKQFTQLSETQIREWGRRGHFIYDLKYILPREAVDLRL